MSRKIIWIQGDVPYSTAVMAAERLQYLMSEAPSRINLVTRPEQLRGLHNAEIRIMGDWYKTTSGGSLEQWEHTLMPIFNSTVTFYNVDNTMGAEIPADYFDTTRHCNSLRRSWSYETMQVDFTPKPKPSIWQRIRNLWPRRSS